VPEYRGLLRELGPFLHYDENGWMSISLRWQTFLWCFSFLISLFVQLYDTCRTQEGHEEYDCTDESGKPFPMISAVITGHISGRVFTFLSAGVMWGVVHKNARVFYRDMHGTLTAKRNNAYMTLCVIAMIALPLAGIFDTYNHRPYHRPFVVLFFITFGFYTVFIAKSICENRHLYPTRD
jgi:hypothetical protein